MTIAPKALAALDEPLQVKHEYNPRKFRIAVTLDFDETLFLAAAWIAVD